MSDKLDINDVSILEECDLETPKDTESSCSDVLSFKEFMDLIRVKKTTMYRIMQSPLAPKFTEIGSLKIITRSDALKWIEKNAGNKII